MHQLQVVDIKQVWQLRMIDPPSAFVAADDVTRTGWYPLRFLPDEVEDNEWLIVVAGEGLFVGTDFWEAMNFNAQTFFVFARRRLWWITRRTLPELEASARKPKRGRTEAERQRLLEIVAWFAELLAYVRDCQRLTVEDPDPTDVERFTNRLSVEDFEIPEPDDPFPPEPFDDTLTDYDRELLTRRKEINRSARDWVPADPYDEEPGNWPQSDIERNRW